MFCEAPEGAKKNNPISTKFIQRVTRGRTKEGPLPDWLGFAERGCPISLPRSAGLQAGSSIASMTRRISFVGDLWDGPFEIYRLPIWFFERRHSAQFTASSSVRRFGCVLPHGVRSKGLSHKSLKKEIGLAADVIEEPACRPALRGRPLEQPRSFAAEGRLRFSRSRDCCDVNNWSTRMESQRSRLVSRRSANGSSWRRNRAIAQTNIGRMDKRQR